MFSKSLRIMVFSLIMTLFISSVALSAPLTSNPDTMPMAYSTGAFGANTAPEGKSPTTGLDWSGEYRPFLVQIDNTSGARPHLNLSEADIVYESINWGPAHTRYTAVYNDNHPSLVGSVRSARWHHCELREEWDCPIVFWGGQQTTGTSIYDFFKVNNVANKFLIDGTRNPGRVPYDRALSRISKRVSPHNAVVDLAYLAENVWPTNDDGTDYVPRNHAFKFSTTPTRGQDSAQEIYICYDAKEYFPHYTFNSASREYERWYNGVEQYDGESGKRIVAHNVIVQYCKLEYFSGSAQRPMITTTKGGLIDAFIDGQHIRGTWVRNTLSDRTIFLDMNGNELTLLPGKTFIQIVPESFEFSYFNADGTERVTNMGTEIEIEQFDDAGNMSEMDQMEDGNL